MDEVMQQRCSKCGEVKSIELFSLRRRGERKRHARCKACMTEAWKKWYAKPENRARHIKHNGGTSRLIIERNQLFMMEYLSRHACGDCGNADIRVLEFDHVRGTKITEVSRTVSAGWSLSRIRAEMDKCDIVCANCHRLRTLARNGSYKHAWLMGDEELESPTPRV